MQKINQNVSMFDSYEEVLNRLLETEGIIYFIYTDQVAQYKTEIKQTYTEELKSSPSLVQSIGKKKKTVKTKKLYFFCPFYNIFGYYDVG